MTAAQIGSTNGFTVGDFRYSRARTFAKAAGCWEEAWFVASASSFNSSSSFISHRCELLTRSCFECLVFQKFPVCCSQAPSASSPPPLHKPCVPTCNLPHQAELAPLGLPPVAPSFHRRVPRTVCLRCRCWCVCGDALAS